MDYNYIHLQQQIKALMNLSHVPASGHSKVAEEVVNGACNFLEDTVQNYFMFKYDGINDPIYVDPIGKRLLNVKFIGDIDLSKVVSMMQEGYGIDIVNMGGGVFKINVKDGMFALKSEVSEVDGKFDDYTTTADLEANYATKTALNDVDKKFENYTLTTDLEANYLDKSYDQTVNEKLKDYPSNQYVDSTFATKSDLENVDKKFDNYTTTTDLEANYMKKDDVVPSGDSQFEVVAGFPEYYVKNEHLVQNTKKFDNLGQDISGLTLGLVLKAEYNILTINLPSEVKTPLLLNHDKMDVLKFVFRKNVIYDLEGRYTKEFTIYVEDRKVYCPIITLDEVGKECKINHAYLDSNDFFIACDTRLSFDPFSLYKQGNLSIMYLLSQDSLVSKQPSIKCNIIDAKNALKLHESDIYYLYKPTIITEEIIDYTYRGLSPDEDKMIDITEQIPCYKMIYELPPSTEYEIPVNLNFKFTEHCFGNVWSLIWDGKTWTGDNVSGRSNGKIVSSKLSLRVDKKYNDYGCSGCYVRCRHDDWNGKFLDNTNFMRGMFSYGKTRLLYKDGSIEDGSKQRIDIERYGSKVEGYNKEGYDYLPIYLRINNSDENVVNDLMGKISKIYLDMMFNGALNRLIFTCGKTYKDQNYGYYIDLIPELDSIEKINYFWSFKHECGNCDARNIELYLRKDYTDPIEEVNWDSETNAFDYIIQQQYYEILPNPNAATTLYTDFNITSSKIITADNITTMRSDLNLVTNTVDVVSYDVKDVKSNVETQNSQMATQKQVTDCLQKDVEKNRLIASTALAFGIVGTAGSIASIGMQLAPQGISFATKSGSNMLTNCAKAPAKKIADAEGYTIFTSLITRSIVTDLTPLLEWCNSEYTPFQDIPFEDEADDPTTSATSLYTTLDICNTFRDSLKPAFKMLTNRVYELTEEMQNIDVTDQLTTLESKFDNKLKEYVGKNELVRDDEIDIFARYDNDNKVLLLEFEDNIVSGLIIFKIFAKSDSTTRQRRLYIKIVDGSITEYHGVQSDTTVDGFDLKRLARSEDDKLAYFPNAELILDPSEKLISIPVNSEYLISGDC